MWIRYRCQHLVLSEASVKGVITRVGARIEGRVMRIEAEVGQNVFSNQVLVRLEDRRLQAALRRAQAELETQTKELASEKMAIEQARRRMSLELERVQAVRKKSEGELEAEQSNLARLQKQYERIASLYRTGAAALNELDRITGDRDRSQGLVNAAAGVLEAAESSYLKALNELDGIQVRESHLAVLESQVVMARAGLSIAEADLDAAVIRSPGDGRVLERIVETGGSARVGEPLIALWLGRPWLEAWDDERDLRKFSLGSVVAISLDSCPGRPLAGRVESIGLVSDKQLQAPLVPPTLHALLRQNAMVPVRIAFEEDAARVQLGLSAVIGIRKNTIDSGSNRMTLARRGAGASLQTSTLK